MNSNAELRRKRGVLQASLHQLVSDGAFDGLHKCRAVLHAAVDEFVSWATLAYSAELRGVAPQIDASMRVMGAVFINTLINRTTPSVAGDSLDEQPSGLSADEETLLSAINDPESDEGMA